MPGFLKIKGLYYDLLLNFIPILLKDYFSIKFAIIYKIVFSLNGEIILINSII